MKINDLKIDASLGLRGNSIEHFEKIANDIDSIENLTVAGMVYDCGDIARQVVAMLSAKGITVSNINICVEM